MQYNDTANKSDVYFTRCLGIYHLQVQPNGNTLRTYISVIVLLSIFSVLSTVGNGLIIYVYIKQKTLQRTNTLLLVCLAFLDFISAVVLEPLYVVRLLSEIFGFTSCVYILIVRRLLEYLRPVSFMTLALVTMERYLALFKAIIHRRMATKRRLLYVVLLIWFVWFLVIFIRSFFPRITSAFYIFFTFVAFSLLMGNLVLYFKIGKLARLHSRPTRISTSPGSLMSTAAGSLIVGDKNSRCIGPGAKNSVVTYSKTKKGVNYGVNEKSRSSTNVGFQHSESKVKSTKILVQPSMNELNKNHVLSNVSKKEIGAHEHQEKDERATKMFQNETNITANNSEKELNNNERKSDSKLHVEDTNLKTEICQQESNNALSDITTHQVKTNINNNSMSTDLTQEGYNTSQATNIQQGNAEHKVTEDNLSPEFNNTNDSRSSTSPETLHKIDHHQYSHEKTIAAKNSSSQFKNAKTSEPPTTGMTKQGTHQTTDQIKLETRERNATRMVFYIVAILTLCFSPIAALLVYLSFEKEPGKTALFIYLPIADTIALFNALVNPFIYCYKNRKMRAAVKNVLQKIWSV